MSVRLAGKLPKGDRDGLQHLTNVLRIDHDTPRLVVAIAVPRKVTENLDDEDDPWTVTLGLTSVEVLDGTEASAVKSFLLGAYERRTGKTELPFGAVFDGPDVARVDPDTGEVFGDEDA